MLIVPLAIFESDAERGCVAPTETLAVAGVKLKLQDGMGAGTVITVVSEHFSTPAIKPFAVIVAVPDVAPPVTTDVYGDELSDAGLTEATSALFDEKVIFDIVPFKTFDGVAVRVAVDPTGTVAVAGVKFKLQDGIGAGQLNVENGHLAPE